MSNPSQGAMERGEGFAEITAKVPYWLWLKIHREAKEHNRSVAQEVRWRLEQAYAEQALMRRVGQGR
jgi:hypothetical protein